MMEGGAEASPFEANFLAKSRAFDIEFIGISTAVL